MISKETIDDILQSVDIVDVINHYIPTFKKGKGFSAVCPFHDDHDPSLSISVDKQLYKCFVCGNGGNAYTFVKNYKKIPFIEAVKEVADIAGKPIEVETTYKKVDPNEKYYKLLNDYIEYTNYCLTGTKLGLSAKDYLINRGIDEEIIKEFKIGFNPDNDKVSTVLKAKEYSDEDMIKVGVSGFGKSGLYDIFHSRITFPIHDKHGSPIAFTARDFTNFSDSKYINSGNTILYNKGNVIFNYHRAIDSSKQKGYVLVCEGVMDVIAYKRAGIDNVVATLGTACTSEQIKLLKELAKVIVLSYDGDRAGKNANLKVGNLLLEQGTEVEVIDNNTELDPDEIITKHGKNALRDLASKRLTYIDFVIKFYKENYNLDNYSNRKKMAIDISALIDKLKDQYDKDNYYNELYEITKIRINSNSSSKTDDIGYNVKGKSYNELLLDGLTKAEYIILSQIAISKEALTIYHKDLGYLLNDTNSKLASIIQDEYRKKDECNLSTLYNEVDDEDVKNLIVTLATVENLPSVYDKDILLGSIKRVKEEIVKQRKNYLKKQIEKAPIIDENVKQMIEEYTEILRELGGKNGN